MTGLDSLRERQQEAAKDAFASHELPDGSRVFDDRANPWTALDKALVAAWAIRDEELEQAQVERDQWKAAYDAWAALLDLLLAGLLEYVSTRPEDEDDAVALVLRWAEQVQAGRTEERGK